jgi:hypothetical protein
MRFGTFPRLFTASSFEKLVDMLSAGLSRLTISDNMDCEIIKDVTVPAGVEVNIPHKLRSVPLYKTILRQTGNGLITDGTANNWTDTNIYLKNNGATDVIITVAIHRS